MKFIALALTIASVGVAARPRTRQAPAIYSPCGTLVNNCCKLNGGKFRDCTILPGAVPNYPSFILACASNDKIPSCCTAKKTENLLEGFFNHVLGTSLGEPQCSLVPSQP